MTALHTVAIKVVYSGNSLHTNAELLQMYTVRVNDERGRMKRKHGLLSDLAEIRRDMVLLSTAQNLSCCTEQNNTA